MILPDGRCDIILRYNVNNPKPPIPVITGPATQPYFVDYALGDSWLGMRMRPACGVLLWKHSVQSAVDTVLQGDEIFDRLPELAKVVGSNLTLAFFAQTMNVNSGCEVDERITRSIDALHASGGRMRVEKLAEFVGCTARQLNRLYRFNIGLSVKSYAQILQFHRTLKLIQLDKLSIVDAAFEGGYSDHAHLTRAFNRFGGFSPSKLPTSLATPSIFG